MSDESCSTSNSVSRCEVKKNISCQRLKAQKHSVSIGLSSFGFPFQEHLNRKFTYAVLLNSRPKVCLRKKIFFPIFSCFFFQKHFIYHCILYIITFYISLHTTLDYFNQESEITGIVFINLRVQLQGICEKRTREGN